MPVQSVIDREQGLVTTIATGSVTFREIYSNQEALKRDPDFQAAFDQLIDVRGVTECVSRHEEVILFARFPMFSPSSRRAWVAGADVSLEMVYAMAVHFMSQNCESRIFHEVAPALDWIKKKAPVR